MSSRRPPKRLRPGTKTLREIKKIQRCYARCNAGDKKITLYQTKPFEDLVRMISQDYTDTNVKFEKKYMRALKEATEMYLMNLFQAAGMIAMNAGKRQTVTSGDLELAYSMKM